jgi:hypothetical protein
MPSAKKTDKLAEVDYEKNPTILYQLILKRDWENVILRTRNYDEEARVFVYRCDDQGLLKWRLLPIHCAILHDSPPDVVEALLKAYRAGAREQDDHGMLPIHLAIKKHAAPEIINMLLSSYPHCIEVSNNNGVTPYEMAKMSSSEHQKYYLRALTPGSSTYVALTATFSDLLCGVNLPGLISH